MIFVPRFVELISLMRSHDMHRQRRGWGGEIRYDAFIRQMFCNWTRFAVQRNINKSNYNTPAICISYKQSAALNLFLLFARSPLGLSILARPNLVRHNPNTCPIWPIIAGAISRHTTTYAIYIYIWYICQLNTLGRTADKSDSQINIVYPLPAHIY